MTIASKQESLILLVGDIFLFLSALWITLFVRYAKVPDSTLLYNHIVPFSFLFVLWIVVYFIAGLYDKHTTLLRSRLSSIILNAQAVNITFAALFFFFIPYFNIAPKTNLILYLIISSLLVLVWRVFIFPKAGFRKKQKTVLIGHSEEVRELVGEVNDNPRYNLEFTLVAEVDKDIDFEVLHKEVVDAISSEEASVIVADIKSRKMEGLLTTLYSLTFLETAVTFIDIHKMYEDIFDRIPFSALKKNWILENVSASPKVVYDVLKRTMDIIIGSVFGLISLVVYPFVYIAIKVEDRGPVFITQKRVGKNNTVFNSYKFRSMNRSEDGVWVGETDNKITTVGHFIRKTRIDELPQLWNILRGDLSFVGPRPDILGLNQRLSEEIEYYNVRNVIKPGLTGWAQIKQDYGKGNQVSPQSVVDTKTRLMYDVYYIKNRSFLLDIEITLRTIKTVLSKFGS
ncbi:exopolysaccharide biosynthesis polyprenyl glycosylphosphotransferase [Candidatus Kaiserbacteria bacterium]|nr:exopolysaccharide biosynthesis polyprenyl glycosylphosphotransferase [Candidatus Kaiserbacteria bacterium]